MSELDLVKLKIVLQNLYRRLNRMYKVEKIDKKKEKKEKKRLLPVKYRAVTRNWSLSS